MILTRISFLALSALYTYMGIIFLNSMESTRVADLGYYQPDVIAFVVSMTCFVFATFSLLYIIFFK